MYVQRVLCTEKSPVGKSCRIMKYCNLCVSHWEKHLRLRNIFAAHDVWFRILPDYRCGIEFAVVEFTKLWTKHLGHDASAGTPTLCFPRVIQCGIISFHCLWSHSKDVLSGADSFDMEIELNGWVIRLEHSRCLLVSLYGAILTSNRAPFAKGNRDDEVQSIHFPPKNHGHTHTRRCSVGGGSKGWAG